MKTENTADAKHQCILNLSQPYEETLSFLIHETKGTNMGIYVDISLLGHNTVWTCSKYIYFEETYHHHFQGTTTQKTNIPIFTTTKT